MSPSFCSAAFVTVGGAHPAVTVVLVVDAVSGRVVAVVAGDGAGDSSGSVAGAVVEEDGTELSTLVVVGGASPSGELAATSVLVSPARWPAMTKTAPTTSTTDVSPAIHRRFADRRPAEGPVAVISGSSISFR
jgi:hypothetical protein